MDAQQWERHREDWCDRCRHQRRCPAIGVMNKHPEDVAADRLFNRLGHRSQFVVRP